MLHEVAEPVLYLVALALVAGAAVSAWRGPVPAGRYFAGHLAIAALLLLDRLEGGRTSDGVEVVLVAASATLLVLFVGHVPRRRDWFPTGGRGEALFAGVLFVLLLGLYGFGRMPNGVAQEELVWRYLPVLFLGALLPGLVALLLMFGAHRATGRVERHSSVWLALAFALAAAESAYRVRLISGVMARSGPNTPDWVMTLNRMDVASYGGGLVLFAAAVLVAVLAMVRHRDSVLPFVLFVGATGAAAFLGERLAVWALQTPGPSAAFTWGVLIRTLDDLALAVLGTWAVVRLTDSRRSTAAPPPDEVPLEIVQEPGGTGTQEGGDATRFHPRLGLDETER